MDPKIKDEIVTVVCIWLAVVIVFFMFWFVPYMAG